MLNCKSDYNISVDNNIKSRVNTIEMTALTSTACTNRQTIK